MNPANTSAFSVFTKEYRKPPYFLRYSPTHSCQKERVDGHVKFRYRTFYAVYIQTTREPLRIQYTIVISV